MKFKAAAQLSYEVRTPSTLILNIHALRTPAQTVLEESFTTEPYFKAEELTSPDGNRLLRLDVPEATSLNITYTALVDNAVTFIDEAGLINNNISLLDASVLPYLYPSRYCQSDKLYRLAGKMFGYIINPFEKVAAITDWIYNNVEYLSGSTDAQTSAFDTVTERAGVCRDFAHLGIALCRALDIPARYFTGYAYQLSPPDFHACFEAYIGNQWILFDPTKLAPLNGMVRISTGRDAADSSIANLFGDIMFNTINVSCELAEGEQFQPYFYLPAGLQGIVCL